MRQTHALQWVQGENLQFHQLQKVHALQPFLVYPQREGYFEVGKYLNLQHQGGRKIRRRLLAEGGTLLYTALIGYIHYEAPEEEQNSATLIEFINAMEARRMMRPLRTMWIWPSRSWDSGSRITSPCGNIRNTSWRREMYALSDFLIMVFVMVSEAVT